MRRFGILLCAVFLIVSLSSVVMADSGLGLPRIFGDNMVLQSGASVPIWGWAAAGTKVSVSVGSQTVSGVAGADGKWMVRLKNLRQSDTPATVTVKADKTITFKNVLIGDVWLGSGQSNMEMAMAEITNANEEIAAADYPKIRLFTVQRNESGILAEDVVGQWAECTPESVRRYSATLYLFGKEIHQKTKVPLGLIHSSVGGTRIELWTPPAGFDLIPDFAHYPKSIAAVDEAFAKTLPERLTAVEEWTKATRKALADNKPIPLYPEWPRRPGPEGGAAVLYNGMIHPIVPYALRGFVWYQGEWNGGENEIYTKRMQALVGGWRKVWGNESLPFYYVQLARMPEKDHSPWLANGLTPTREAQLKALSIPNTGMACIIDLMGSSGWHPGDKQDVGRRLSLWALKNEYGMKSIVPSGPLYKSMRIDDGKIVISFDYADKGLIAGTKTDVQPFQKLDTNELPSFAIAGEDRQWHHAKAVIEGKTVVVSSPEVPNPVAVRYAYCNDPEPCHLYNTDELPASPFRTDDW